MATLDTGIYQNLIAPVKSIAAYGAEMDAADQSRTQNLIGQQRLAEAHAAQQEAARYRTLQAGWGANTTDDERISGLKNIGRFDAADSLLKTGLDRRKSESDIQAKDAETNSKQADLKIKQFQHLAQSFAGVRDQAGYDQAKAMAEMFGFDTSQVPAQYSPEVVQTAQNAFISGAERMADERSRATQAETSRHNTASETLTGRGQDLTASMARRGQDITVRGQNLTDSRARDLNDITRGTKAEEKRTADVDKAVTDFSKTLQKEGVPELETAVAGAEGALGRYKPGAVPGIGAVKNALPAAMMSDQGKDVRQALAQVRNIVLSARSGAAVTDQELLRLVEEIGTGVGMSEADIRKGLTRVRERIESIKTNAAAGVNDDVLTEYEKRGGLPIRRGGKAGGTPDAGAASKVIDFGSMK